MAAIENVSSTVVGHVGQPPGGTNHDAVDADEERKEDKEGPSAKDRQQHDPRLQQPEVSTTTRESRGRRRRLLRRRALNFKDDATSATALAPSSLRSCSCCGALGVTLDDCLLCLVPDVNDHNIDNSTLTQTTDEAANILLAELE